MAAGYQTTTLSPALKVWVTSPWESVSVTPSRVTVRRKWITGTRAYGREAWTDLLAAMRVDKKARADTLRFVVLDGLAKPGILAGPDEEMLERAYAEVAR